MAQWRAYCAEASSCLTAEDAWQVVHWVSTILRLVALRLRGQATMTVQARTRFAQHHPMSQRQGSSRCPDETLPHPWVCVGERHHRQTCAWVVGDAWVPHLEQQEGQAAPVHRCQRRRASHRGRSREVAADQGWRASATGPPAVAVGRQGRAAAPLLSRRDQSGRHLVSSRRRRAEGRVLTICSHQRPTSAAYAGLIEPSSAHTLARLTASRILDFSLAV